MCLYRGEPLAWLFLVVVENNFDLGRLQNNHVIATAALLASAAPPPVLAEVAAAALLALAALPPVLADAAAAALLALGAPPPVLAEATAAALLAAAAPPPVLAEASAAALLASAAYPTVLADAAAAVALLACVVRIGRGRRRRTPRAGHILDDSEGHSVRALLGRTRRSRGPTLACSRSVGGINSKRITARQTQLRYLSPIHLLSIC